MNILNIFRSKASLARRRTKKEHQVEVQRIINARAYMDKWDTIPVAVLWDELYIILDLPPSKGCAGFCTTILCSKDNEQLARDLKILRDYHAQTIRNELINHAKY